MIPELLKPIVALNLVPGLGPVTYRKLMEHFGSPAEVIRAPLSHLRQVEGITETVAKGIKFPNLEARGEEEMVHASGEGIRILTWDDPDYPGQLREIYAPPTILYAKGNVSALRSTQFAIVGCRDASVYGRQTASTIARELAEAGVTVTSGMAMGIDSAAHEGALAAGGTTVAVLGAGLSRIASGSPSEMASRILKSGGVLVSEFPLRMNAAPGHFPIRNRIISGLSAGVLVVEAKAKSGALITVDAALEQGREVYAVPGNIDSIRSEGTHRILKQGAKLVTRAEDILQDLSLSIQESGPRQFKKSADLGPAENTLLAFLDQQPRHVDELISQANLATKDAITALSFLELKGFAKQLPGKNYVSVR